MKEENEKLTDAMEANIEVYKLKIEDATRSLKEETEAKKYWWEIMDLHIQETETLQEEEKVPDQEASRGDWDEWYSQGGTKS